MHKGKKFVVTFGHKQGHYWANFNRQGESIYVNGKNGPVLHLFRGVKYVFQVEQHLIPGAEAPHLFYLTNSPMGGKHGLDCLVPGSFEPLAHGKAYFQVTQETPRYFYYQDARQYYAGGLVIVHEQGESVY